MNDPNFPLVCPSNCGSATLALIIATKPSLTSSPVSFTSFSLTLAFELNI